MVQTEADGSKWSGWTALRRADPRARPTTERTRHVNSFYTEAELKALRHILAHGTPFGVTRWQTKTAAMLGLESSLRPRGRPKKRKSSMFPFAILPTVSSHRWEQHAFGREAVEPDGMMTEPRTWSSTDLWEPCIVPNDREWIKLGVLFSVYNTVLRNRSIVANTNSREQIHSRRQRETSAGITANTLQLLGR